MRNQFHHALTSALDCLATEKCRPFNAPMLHHTHSHDSPKRRANKKHTTHYDFPYHHTSTTATWTRTTTTTAMKPNQTNHPQTKLYTKRIQTQHDTTLADAAAAAAWHPSAVVVCKRGKESGVDQSRKSTARAELTQLRSAQRRQRRACTVAQSACAFVVRVWVASGGGGSGGVNCR